MRPSTVRRAKGTMRPHRRLPEVISEGRLSVRVNDGARQFDKHIRSAHQGGTVLAIPLSIKYAGALGRSVAYAQFVATWAAAHATPKIETKLSNSSPDDYERFVSRLHGLAAAYYAEQITADDGQTNLRGALLKAAKPRISAMSERRFNEAARGQLTELVFVTHARNQFHSAVYRRTPTMADLMDPERHGELIVSPREMNALVRNILHAQKLRDADLRSLAPLLDNKDLPLGQMLHETFRNTAEHAYLIHGRIPPKGLRCILINVLRIQPDALQPRTLICADHPHVDHYFQSLRDRAGRGRRRLVHMLEISVFDTGPGFAATIGPTVDGYTGDAKRVAACFRDHVSSKTGRNSGLGLGRVLSCVDSLDGFLRIRTSTTEVFFSSYSHPTASSPVPSVAEGLPKATGTSLTIAVPLAL